MVVIAIIAILAALLLPALSQAKARAQALMCMSNSKQLAVAFHMYSSDSTDFYPPNPDDGTLIAGYNWCAGSVSGGMPGVAPAAHTFDPDILRDSSATLIAPYITRNVGIFKCPADPRQGTYQGTDPSMFGKSVPAARSFSLNQGVGTIDPGFATAHSGHSGTPTFPTMGPWLTGTRSGNQHDNPWATFGRDH